MNELFWLGQVGWIAGLAYGAYLSLKNAHLADAERARTVRPDKSVPQNDIPSCRLPSFN